MNLFQMASRGVDLDTLPDDNAPRPMIDFGPTSGPSSRVGVPAGMDSLFDAAASEYGVDPTILKGIAYAESRFRPDVIDGTTKSSAGALGMMQFMPATAKEMGINPLDPAEAVFGAAAYLRQSLDKFDGDTERAVASYNWGRNRSAFDKDDWYKSLPAETRNYVGTVLEFADSVGPSAPATGKQVPLLDGVAPSQAGGGRGMANPSAKDTAATMSAREAPQKGVLQRVGDELGQLRDEFFSGVTGVSANLQAVNAGAAANQLLQRQEALTKLEKAGQGSSPEADGLRKYITHASARLGGMAADAADAGALSDAAGRMTTRPELRAVTDAKTFGESWEAFKKNPYAVIAGTTAQSMPQMIPMIIAAAAAGPAGGAAVAGGTSALTEFGSGIREFARDNGVDPSDKEGLAKLFADPDLLRAATTYAGKGGLIVGALDAASGGIAGKTLVPGAIKNHLVRQAINMPVQAGLQGAMGGAGEAGKQLAQKGEIDQPGQVLAEIVGELGGAPVEVLALSKDARQAFTSRQQAAPVPKVQDQPTTPQAPVVTTAAPSAAQGAPVVPTAPVQVAKATQAVANIESLMAPTQAQPAPVLAEASPAQQVDTSAPALDAQTAVPTQEAPSQPALAEAAPTVEQAEQQLAAREAAPAPQAAPVDMQMRTTGTLLVKGDPVALRARLAASGVDNTITVPGGLVVARTQAAKAQEALSAPTAAPAQTPAPQQPATAAVTAQQEAANVPQVQTPAPEQQAQAAGPAAPAVAQADGAVPAAGVPAAGATTSAQADGVTGQKIDSEWTAFAPESGTRAVPRAEMPQIKAEHRGAMVNFLKARGVEATQDEVPASSLKPTQAEFSPAKVAQAKGFTGGDRSILVSSDGHVLDGHHQWLAKREAGEPVKVIRLDAPIADLLPLVKEFPSSTQAEGATAPQESTNADPTPPGVRLADERTPGAAPAAQVGQSEQAGRSDPAEAVAGVQPAVSAGSGGRAAHPVTRTPAFQRWFGGSKVKDANGAPRVMYHGTGADFGTFSEAGFGGHFTSDTAVASRFAGVDGGRVLPVYLSLKNPLRVADHGGTHTEAKGVAEALVDAKALPADYLDDAFYERLMKDGALGNSEKYEANNLEELRRMRDALEAQGYDGIVYNNTAEGGGDSYIAFRGTQVKSAAGNNGQFDPANADIRYSKFLTSEQANDLMSVKPPIRIPFVSSTKEAVQAALDRLVGAGGRLPNGLGKIVVAYADEIKPHWEPLIGRVEVASESAGRAQGFFDSRTDTIFLIADHIRAGQEMAVAAHELMHKHGEAVLGTEGWKRLQDTVELWAAAPEGSTERQVYDEAVARVEASRPGDISIHEYTGQELIPYVAQVAFEMGIKPSVMKPVGTVEGWLAHLRGVIGKAWEKITNRPDLFKSQDLVDLVFAVAQRENPATGAALDNITTQQAQTAAESLEQLSATDALFALPKSSATTVEAMAAETDPGIQVTTTKLGNETMHTLRMPDGSTAYITERPAGGEAVYGQNEATGRWITERPGDNAQAVEGEGDVWIDVSGLKPGRAGGQVYNLAANYAHNTGQVFIGDPSGLSDVALRRRAEQMLSSALKFGTTEHLAPHPRQMVGDAGLGVPPLRWTYGDHAANVQALIDVNQAALENGFPDAKSLTYDLDTGNFIDQATGRTLTRRDMALAARGARKEADAVRAGAGWRTAARSAVFRALLGQGAGSRNGEGSSERDAVGSGRGSVLDRPVYESGGPAQAREREQQRSRGTLEGLVREVGRLGDSEPGQRIFYSRSSGDPVTPEQKKPALQWRDETGRLQFAPGQWLYDRLGAAAGPMLGALGMKAATPELRRQLRMMKLQVQRAQELSAKVATEAAKLSAVDRAMVSDLVEKDMQAGTVPPEHAVKLASIISNTMDQQSKELVELGMLSKESAERWEGTYLPRFYESKLRKKVGDAWADAMRRLVGRPRLMKGIGGKHLKGRGIFETIDPASLENYQALGWEVRDPDYQPGTSTEVQVWRDFNREERAKMGEIRDAGFRFVMGYMQTQRDIALGRMFENLSTDDRFSSRLPTKEMTVRVPDSKVEGTGAHTYGKLAGRYVSKETLSHLSSFDEVHNDTLQMYRQAMSLWKEGKTVLNPVAHMNNVVSNLTMAHLAGISYHRGDKYIGALADFVRGSPMIEDAKDAGLFLGSFSESELMQQMPDDLKKLVNLQEGVGAKTVKTGMAFMTWMLRKPMGKAYEFEDSFFKYMLYKDARQRGLEQQDAIDFAQRYIFTYDDLPKGARRIRDFGIPFFAYTYKAVPALLHTAMAHPVRMATPAALLWTATALTYAAMADGDDDTPWDELAKKYLTDADFRKKAGEAREFDQKHMPTWMRGSTAFFTPKTMRVGYDKVMDLPVFLDISRFIPGGDMMDITPNAGGLPLPQPITPNHPLLTMAMGLLGNKDLFTGKELVDKNDTKGEAAEKRLMWIYRQVAPAVAIGQYHWDRGMNMVAQASGGEITWLPEMVSEKYTGIGGDGLPVLPQYGIPQTFGIKVRPMDQDKAAAIERAIDKKLIQSIDADIRQLARQNRNGTLSDKSFEKQREYQREKRDRLRDGLTVDGAEKE